MTLYRPYNNADCLHILLICMSYYLSRKVTLSVTSNWLQQERKDSITREQFINVIAIRRYTSV